MWGEEPTLCNAPGATLGRSTIYLIIIILFISLLRTLLLSPFVLIWLRKGVYRVSEGGVNRDPVRDHAESLPKKNKTEEVLLFRVRTTAV